MALYILVYVGVEVTIGGWIVTYLKRWTVVIWIRFVWLLWQVGSGSSRASWVNRKVGEKKVVFVYAALVIGLEITIWLVLSLIGNALAVSVVGLLLGPMYPICMNEAGKVLPRRVLTGSIGCIAGSGTVGSTILPFMTGALASRFDIGALQSLIVAMTAFMVFLWALVPSTRKRDE